jgi:predicted phosphoribosyltransferase
MVTTDPFHQETRFKRFSDRTVAGRLLARRLAEYRGRGDVVVLALPRGGVPVAFEVARELRAPLDVLVVRRLGVPGYPELAMGAVATGGVRTLNDEVVADAGVSREQIDQAAAVERRELERRERAYRGGAPPPDLSNRTAILVDDGLATGATMAAAAVAARRFGARRVVVAVPVAAVGACGRLAHDADEVVTVMTPHPFAAIGRWYDDFGQVGDREVRQLLEQSTAASRPAARFGTRT